MSQSWFAVCYLDRYSPPPKAGWRAVDAAEVDAAEVDAAEVDAAEVDAADIEGARRARSRQLVSQPDTSQYMYSYS